MKKLLLSILIFFFACYNAQGKLFLENYSNYDLQMRFVAQNSTNCAPEVAGSLSFPANTQEEFDNYNDTPPYATGWSVVLPGSTSAINQPVPGSGLLTTLSTVTQWKYSWFKTVYAGTLNSTNDIDFNMADPLNLPCGFSGTDFVDGALTDAFWFYLPSMNATYLIVQ